jgi:hypothetical protein
MLPGFMPRETAWETEFQRCVPRSGFKYAACPAAFLVLLAAAAGAGIIAIDLRGFDRCGWIKRPLQIGNILRFVRLKTDDVMPSIFRALFRNVQSPFLGLHPNNNRPFLGSNFCHVCYSRHWFSKIFAITV